MIGYIVVAFVIGFVLGLLCMAGARGMDNLTKEEYAHCVQIVINDFDKAKGDAQRLLLELQNYATNEDIAYADLSADAREIVDKVKDYSKPLAGFYD